MSALGKLKSMEHVFPSAVVTGCTSPSHPDPSSPVLQAAFKGGESGNTSKQCTCAQPLSRVRPCDPMDCSPPGSCVHGILQVRILERLAMPSSRGSSQPGDQTQAPTLQVDPLPTEQPEKPLAMHTSWKMSLLSALIALSLTPAY